RSPRASVNVSVRSSPCTAQTADREPGPPLVRMSSPLTARRAFVVALGFLLVTAALGTLLRLHAVVALPGFVYGNVLHAHSHVAFLGWVFNAFLALVLVHFAPA